MKSFALDKEKKKKGDFSRGNIPRGKKEKMKKIKACPEFIYVQERKGKENALS